MVDASTISAGDTAWMLTATALVLLMTLPGIALFYAGMVAKKMCGDHGPQLCRSLPGHCYLDRDRLQSGVHTRLTFSGRLDRIMLHGMAFLKDAGKISVSHIAPTIPESVFVMFQMAFAITTPALLTGAFAE